MANTIRRHELSWGVLLLILCLALPMGLLSQFAPGTTADEVDAADSVMVARLTAKQHVRDAGSTLLQFTLDHVVVGSDPGARFEILVEGRPALEVGDLVLALLSADPPGLHGIYQVQKDPKSLDYMVLSPVSGLSAEGIFGPPPLLLEHVEDAIRLRNGLGSRSSSRSETPPDSQDGDDSSDLAESASGGDDHGNSIPTGTPVDLKLPHMVTGMPTLVTGFLNPGDVDYFTFDAPVLSLLYAETQLPEGLTSVPPDTIMGLFSVKTGDLLAHDDDSGVGTFSKFAVGIDQPRPFSVAVEGAPDPDLNFTGAEGTQTGPYVLSLELQQASYISNSLSFLVGVSPDGTFIEDFVGFKRVGSIDVLRDGVEGDGWGLEFDVQGKISSRHFYGGSGDFLVAPSFNTEVSRSLFSLGPFGGNRRGLAESSTMVPYKGNDRAVEVRHQYTVQLWQTVLKSNLIFTVANEDRIRDIVYRRLMDVDLFDVSEDTFYWSFDPDGDWLVYPTEVTESLDDPAAPATSTGQVTGDRQVAIVAKAGSIFGASADRPVNVAFPVSFTLIDEFVSELDAVQSAVQNLISSDAESWTVAVDQDPATGLYMAFGIGLGESISTQP
ncbi:MAG: hypothetical protein P8N09_06880 [Planctomycetota bacterium]|nr:hypothetical protein [Planctomycetota bacterium]